MCWYENINIDQPVYQSVNELLTNNSSLLEEESIIYLINYDSGFGSNLVTLVQNSLYLNQINKKIHCLGYFSKNGNSFKYHDISYNNSFFLYFTYLNTIPENTKYYFVNSGVNPNLEYVKDQHVNGLNVNDIQINQDLSDHFKQKFKIKNTNDIINHMNDIKDSTKIPLIGIHIRSYAQILVHNTSHATITERIINLKNELDKKYNNYNIFLATDVFEYIDRCKNIYNDTETKIFYNENISRIDNDGDGKDGNLWGYKDSMSYLQKDTGFKLGRDIITDCMSLINCDVYYTSISNIAFMTSFFNDKNNGIHHN